MCSSNVLSTVTLSAIGKLKRHTVGDTSSRIRKIGLLEDGKYLYATPQKVRVTQVLVNSCPWGDYSEATLNGQRL